MSSETKGAPQAPVQATQPAATEAAKPQQSPEQDARFAQLAKKEKAIQAAMRQLRQERDSFSKQKTEAQKPSGMTADEWRNQFLKDPMSVGVDYNHLAQLYMQQPTPENQQVRALQAQIEQLRNELNKGKETIEASQKRSYETAIKGLTREAKLLVDSDARFETIKAAGEQDAIVDLIKQTYEEDGFIMGVDEAAQQVEEYLVERAKSLASVEKVKKLLSPPPAVEEQPQKQAATQQQQSTQTKTLTNAISTSSKPSTSRERRDRAIAAFLGNLKG